MKKLNSHHSIVIDYLRFPMMVMVCFIHANIGEYKFGGEIPDEYRMFGIVYSLVGNGACRIAVPLFFLISGFLFFNNIYSFSLSTFGKKLKKRMSSIVLPYLIWNTIYAVLWLILAKCLPSLSAGSIADSFQSFSLETLVRSYWDIIGGKFPADGPTWFLRDLIIINLFSPVIYFLVRKFGGFVLCVLFIVWTFNFCPDMFIRMDGFFFYFIGAYLMLHGKWLDIAKSIPTISFLGGAFLLLLILSVYIPFCGRIQILLGIIFIISILTFFAKHEKLKMNKFLMDSNFFIYVYHAIPIAFIGKCLLTLFNPSHNISLVAIYLVTVFLTVLIGLLIYRLLALIPSFYLKKCLGINR